MVQERRLITPCRLFPIKSDLFAYWPVFIKPEPLFCCGLYKICVLEHECSGAAIYRIDPFQSVKRLTFLWNLRSLQSVLPFWSWNWSHSVHLMNFQKKEISCERIRSTIRDGVASLFQITHFSKFPVNAIIEKCILI